MVGFVGRENELSRLEDIWGSDGRKAVVMYGRRRIGKSELLRRFCSERRSIYIECVQGSLEDNLHIIAGVLGSLDGRNHTDYGNLKDALDDIIDSCRAERTVVVLDELPYLVSTGPQVASHLQHFMDHLARETDAMVVMCGSSISVMKRETTDSDRPLYGRFDHRFEVEPMPYRECAMFHPDMPDIDRLMLYMTVGGIPKYHLDPHPTDYRTYIERHFLSPDGDMRDEAESIIAMEFAPRGRYMAIVNAISDGRTSLKEIAERSGLDKAMCLRCLDELREVGVVDIIHPMMGAPKRPVYRVRDNMVAFCQDVVMASKTLPMADPARKYDILEQRIRSFLGHMYEDLCADYVVRHWECLEIGKWWGPNEDKEIRELDIVATVLENNVKVSLFGDCKFMRDEYVESTLRRFRRTIELTRDDRTQRLVLFSVSGFCDEIEDEASSGFVTLVGLDDLIRG